MYINWRASLRINCRRSEKQKRKKSQNREKDIRKVKSLKAKCLTSKKVSYISVRRFKISVILRRDFVGSDFACDGNLLGHRLIAD
jgi:hypothetical protein